MSTRRLLLLALLGIVLFALFGHSIGTGGYWNLNIPYPTGVTTNSAAILPGTDGKPYNGSGNPTGTYVGRDWTAQPFGG
jgi:hypothetical protein